MELFDVLEITVSSLGVRPERGASLLRKRNAVPEGTASFREKNREKPGA